MARPQAELQTVLEELPGVTAAYFQKPLNVQLKPTYIVYELSNDHVDHADNIVYAAWNRYTVTVVAREPDSPLVQMVRELPHSKFDRSFVSAGLNHFVFNLFF